MNRFLLNYSSRKDFRKASTGSNAASSSSLHFDLGRFIFLSKVEHRFRLSKPIYTSIHGEGFWRMEGTLPPEEHRTMITVSSASSGVLATSSLLDSLVDKNRLLRGVQLILVASTAKRYPCNFRETKTFFSSFSLNNFKNVLWDFWARDRSLLARKI